MSKAQLISAEPFSYRSTKNGLVQISYDGKTVATLSGKEGAQFLANVESADRADAQMAMANATGHFKHGNERLSKNGRK